MNYAAFSYRFAAVFALAVGGNSAQSQSIEAIAAKRSIAAERIGTEIIIDGQLTDSAWVFISGATDFTQLQPHPGISPSQPTIVKFGYDDAALYIGARMWDTEPDSILHQLSQRDQKLNTDDFGIWFSTFNDGVNGVMFNTTPDGVQIDEKMTPDGEDSWDAVWDVACQIDSLGWTAEFRIPWMVFRFPEKSKQIWGMNFWRGIQRHREISVWNPMDPSQGNLNQGGILTGIRDIDPPLRLSLYPYFSTNVTHVENESETAVNGGMDLKVGLGNSFTLDMTLIPDFRQVVSDNLVLNLSPFEIEFDENRQFFKEGTELFNKNGIVYSRRIGENGRLLNATKVSGRTDEGMGIGYLQAISTSNEDSSLTSYSVAVLDQNLPNNGYITTTGTFVAREGNRYDAWVQAASFEVRDEKNLWSLSGGGAINRKFQADENSDDEGDAWQVVAERIAGNLTFALGHMEESVHFDPNDLGYLKAPNEVNTFGEVRYSIFEPFGRFNNMDWSLGTNFSQVESPRIVRAWRFEANWRALTRKFNMLNLTFVTQPTSENNIFASRIDGLIWKQPAWWVTNCWFSSDYRKKFALDIGGWMAAGAEYNDWKENTLRIAPRVRLNDRTMLTYVWKIIAKRNERGWADLIESPTGTVESLFGKRNNKERTQVLNLSYVFTNRMSISARIRHSWSQVRYAGFYTLPVSGTLQETDLVALREDGTSEYDVNYNAWSVDLVYRWTVSPGSEINLVWKNNLEQDQLGEALPDSYGQNFQQMIDVGFVNSLSVRLVWFIDYSRIKQGLRGFQNAE